MNIKVALVVVAAVLTNAPLAHAQVALKLAFFGSDKDPTYSHVIVPWMAEVNKKGEGIVKIDGFPGGALGRDPRLQVKLIDDGVVDMAWVVPAYTPGRFRDNDVMELPGVFNDVRESSLVFQRLYAKGLLSGYENYYPVLLSTTHPYSIHTVDPVNKIADLKGMKLRAGGPVAGASMRALGVVPVGMPVTAIAENISKGILQGTAAEWNVMYAFRIIDVAKNHFMARLGTVPLSVLFNKKRFDALPQKAKDIIRSTSGETLTKKFGDVHYAIQGTQLAATMKMADHKIVIPSPEVQKNWDAALKPVVENWVKTDPKGTILYNAVLAELKTIRGR
jgi:TRAP-type C4-dicarboxylate transport system substrate-binding protein